ncbi:MAG: putative cell division protein FtsQ [Actinomycetota bacterium]
MTEPDHDSEHVPDQVLDELMVAFSKETEPPEKGFDFDDPSIDRLLGLTPAELAAFDDDEDDDFVDDDDDDDDDDQSVVDTEPVPVTAAESARRTILIEHEEQPDTVYLDAQTEERFRGERSTVVIGDLDDGRQSTQPAPGTGSANNGGMDPRIRARRIANRRAEGRRRLIWVTIASAIVLIVVAAIAVVASPIFDVRDVRVQGAVYTDEDVLTQVVDSLQGHPVLLVDTEAAQRTLEAVPWVERARVTTDFPHTVIIDIRERTPVATFQGGDQKFRVIDAQGRVLDVITGQPVGYPLITGDNPDTERGQFAGAPYASAGELVLALPPEIRTITKSIGVDSATGTLSMVLTSPDDGKPAPITVRLGDDSALDDKLARLLQQVRGGLDGVCSIDVSTSEVGVVPGC